MKNWVFICLLCCIQALNAQEGYLNDALLVEKYLQSVSIENDDGIGWPVKPENDSIVDISLYSGMTGIVLFYLELYHVTGDDEYLSKAQRSAAYLKRINIPDTLPTYQLGLYTGAAGMAFTLEEVFQSTYDEDARTKGFEWLLSISKHLKIASQEESFGGFTDIVYGASGIGLTALYFLEKYQEEWIDQLVVNCADYLLQHAVEEGNDVRWKMSPQVSYFMDNFSHGTSGNAYFLLKAFQHTGDFRYKEEGIKAAEYLLRVADQNGMVCHHDPGGENLIYLSWCHGPPGTSRLYYLMYELTGDNKWKEIINTNAKALVEMNLHENQTPGFWNNEGWCCGTVGISSYLSHPIFFPNAENHSEVKMLEERMRKNALIDPDGMRWRHAENRRSPDEITVQTGLMQGSAGFGLYFLRRHLDENSLKWSIVLPDEIGN